ncbi:MAG TPA: site-specific DNA-methyltransferase [Xanthobacteraceae bacterium]|nr:site-specific DNA-methyltransferase [Xanthobacteraceae bacterium]
MIRFELHQGDAVEWLASLPSGSIDLAITDPAYESLEKYRAIGTTTRLKQSAGSSNAWFQIFKNERFPPLFAELYRVLREDSHLYMFCDQETAFIVKPMGEAAGFKFWKPLVWDKVTIGMGYHYRARYEFILFFEKGKRQLNDLSYPDVLTCNRVRGGYPTEKPVMVCEWLITQSSIPGDLVIDPFMGSGSVGVAAMKMRRDFAGNDLADFSLEIADQRLRDAGGVQAEAPGLARSRVAQHELF